jgi:hemoglobin
MISSMVDQFVTNILADSRINRRFATADIARLRSHLVDQLCMVTGGPCTYAGRDMKSAHAGLKITGGEFAALMEDLATALDRLKVPVQEKDQLLALLTPMKKTIVE